MQADPYLRQVATLGDKREVVTTENILNDDGVSLVKEGVQIDGSLYDRLIRHKLLRPLDYSLATVDTVSPHSLISDAEKLLSEEPELALAVDDCIIVRDLLTPIGQVKLESPLAFKLTVCREQSPRRYQHLIRVTLIALYLAARLHWSETDKQELATATLFHDLGEMHLEPSLFDSTHQLTLAELRQIYAHPTIAYLFLKEFTAYHPRISHIVHQHHERLDGSGYPKGLSGDDIFPAARLLGAAELLVVVRLQKQQPCHGLCSTAEVLKLNADRLGCDLILPLVEAAKRVDKSETTHASIKPVNGKTLQARLSLLLEILQGADSIDIGEEAGMASFISNQMQEVNNMVNRCGLSLSGAEPQTHLLGEDPQTLSEVDAMVREMIFLVQSTIREAQRRWIKDEIAEKDETPLTTWIRNSESALFSAGFQSRNELETF
ncbi:MAG: HD domain-containing protein [Candidatus Thiodiazotropha sp. (ex Monitilora ramsayi)]|nr:HD domain-containing protein [Candidatus Thiodiazotropha sp. (ex Monitilora ramsayi)]